MLEFIARFSKDSMLQYVNEAFDKRKFLLAVYLDLIYKERPTDFQVIQDFFIEKMGQDFVMGLDINPTLRLMLRDPKDAAEWELLYYTNKTIFREKAIGVIQSGEDEQFELLLGLPFFDPFVYRRGVATLNTVIDESKLEPGVKASRMGVIKERQEAYVRLRASQTLGIDFSKADFSMPDLTQLKSELASIARPHGDNPTVQHFLHLLAWLKARGFERLPHHLKDNTVIRGAASFEQIVSQLTVLCARIAEKMKAESTFDRTPFENADIVGQALNCPEGVIEALSALDAFLGVSFEQQLLDAAIKESLVPFVLQHNINLAMQVHVDQASLMVNMGLMPEKQYRDDSYRLAVPGHYLTALSRKSLSIYQKTLFQTRANLLNRLEALGQSKKVEAAHLVQLKQLCDLIEPLGYKKPWITILTNMSSMTSEDAIKCVEKLLEAEIPKIEIDKSRLDGFKSEIQNKFFPVLQDITPQKDALTDFLCADEFDLRSYQSFLDMLLNAPDGLYLAKDVIESFLRAPETSWHPERLLLTNTAGESLLTSFAKDPILSEWVVGRRLNREPGVCEMQGLELGHQSLYELAASLKAHEASAEAASAGAGQEGPFVSGSSLLDSQIDQLFHADGAINFCLGYLVNDPIFALTIEKILAFLSDNTVYSYNSFADLLRDFSKKGNYEKTLVKSFWEARLAVQEKCEDWAAYVLTAFELQVPLKASIIAKIDASGVIEGSASRDVYTKYISLCPPDKASIIFDADYQTRFIELLRLIPANDLSTYESFIDKYREELDFGQKQALLAACHDDSHLSQPHKLIAHHLLKPEEGRDEKMIAHFDPHQLAYLSQLPSIIHVFGGKEISMGALGKVLSSWSRLSDKNFDGMQKTIEALGGKDITKDRLSALFGDSRLYDLRYSIPYYLLIPVLGGRDIKDELLTVLLAEAEHRVGSCNTVLATYILNLGGESISDTHLNMLLSCWNVEEAVGQACLVAQVIVSLGGRTIKEERLQELYGKYTNGLSGIVQNGQDLLYLIHALGGSDIGGGRLCKLLTDCIKKIDHPDQVLEIIAILNSRNTTIYDCQNLLTQTNFIDGCSISDLRKIISAFGGVEIQTSHLELLLCPSMCEKITDYNDLHFILEALGGPSISEHNERLLFQRVGTGLLESTYRGYAWRPTKATLDGIFRSGRPFHAMLERAANHKGASRKTLEDIGFFKDSFS